MRVFLDANVLFSAAKTDGAVRMLLKRLMDLGHECWVDAYVVTEARRNLLSKGPQCLETLEALLLGLKVAPAASAGAGLAGLDWLPEKDQPVLASAIRLRCDALVTGDRTHFGSGYGRTFEGVTVQSPRSLAEAVLPVH